MFKLPAWRTFLVIGTFLVARPCWAGTFEDAQAAWDAGRYEQSTQLWLKSSQEGNSSAEIAIGNNYRSGLGVPKIDLGEALRWYKISASHGNAAALTLVARAYMAGEGVSPDPVEGARLNRQAADKGVLLLTPSLGRIRLTRSRRSRFTAMRGPRNPPYPLPG